MVNASAFKNIWLLGLGLASLVVGISSTPASQAEPASVPQQPPVPDIVDFNQDVRPILSQHCWPCHGPDLAMVEQTGGLRLDSLAGATEDRNRRQAIVPGDVEKSWMFNRIEPRVDALRMPPPSSPIEALTPRQIEILKKWVASGAQYDDHWAFLVPQKSEVPQVKNTAWPRNPVDHFIAHRHESLNLAPEPEASPERLIRRVALVLTGLPPTPEEIAAFLADPSPDAYEKMVDRYLDSPAYGEHQTRYWLDAVRYGDTHGLHLDNYREIYPYRDWVVRAYNDDLPYDDFLLWQLAGDLLPDPTLDQLVATGYVRMNVTTNEGGAIEQEFLVKNTADRVDTTSTVFLGLTMACARCHDHKYDPLSHKDYYSLYAYFNSTQDPPLDANSAIHAPVIKAPDPDQRRQDAAYQAQLRTLEARVPDNQAKAWAQDIVSRIPRFGPWQKTAEPYQGENFDHACATAFPPEDPDQAASVKWADLDLKDGQRINQIVGKENAATYLRTTLTAPKATRYTLRMGADDGLKVWLNGHLVHNNSALGGLIPDSDVIELDLKEGENALLVKVINGPAGDGVQITYGDEAFNHVQRSLNAENQLDLDPVGLQKIKSLFLRVGPSTPASPEYQKLYAEHQALLAAVPTTLVAKEMDKPRPAHILNRGEYDQPTEEVTRAVPAALNPLPKGASNDRLGLAQWMLDEQNPLVLRVYTNRLWQYVFGTGIVKTSEDFGSQGSYPTHPELLDWLTIDFRENGWSTKRFLRQLLTSATFRQNSAVTAEKLHHDPENLFLTRGPRYRLDAEVIRDQALFVAGLLNPKMGGPGVRPYQPGGLWEAVGFPSSDTARYVQDQGDALYRRSLYLFWKRTSPPAFLSVFDAPTREACVVRRSVTNTPAQALASLNETALVEAARIMAERLVSTPGDPAAKARLGFRLVVARDPSDRELAVVLDFYQNQKTVYQNAPEKAAQLLSVGEKPRNPGLDPVETAAWTMVCNLLLNLDEALTLN